MRKNISIRGHSRSSKAKAFALLVSVSLVTACESTSDAIFLAGSVVDGVVYLGTLGTVYTGLGPGGADLVDKGEFNSHFSVQEPNQEFISDMLSVGAAVAEEYSTNDQPDSEFDQSNDCGGINKITCR